MQNIKLIRTFTDMNKRIHGNVTYPFATLEVGEAFTVPAGRINSMNNSLRTYNKNNPDRQVFVNYDRGVLSGEVEVFRVRRKIVLK